MTKRLVKYGLKTYVFSDEPLYLCDPDKNLNCAKEICGECYLTSNKNSAKDDDTDPIYIFDIE